MLSFAGVQTDEEAAAAAVVEEEVKRDGRKAGRSRGRGER